MDTCCNNVLAGEEREDETDEEWALGCETPRARAPKQGSLGFSVVGFLSAPGEQAQLGVFVSDIVPGGVAHRSSPTPTLRPPIALNPLSQSLHEFYSKLVINVHYSLVQVISLLVQ